MIHFSKFPSSFQSIRLTASARNRRILQSSIRVPKFHLFGTVLSYGVNVLILTYFLTLRFRPKHFGMIPSNYVNAHNRRTQMQLAWPSLAHLKSTVLALIQLWILLGKLLWYWTPLPTSRAYAQPLFWLMYSARPILSCTAIACDVSARSLMFPLIQPSRLSWNWMETFVNVQNLMFHYNKASWTLWLILHTHTVHAHQLHWQTKPFSIIWCGIPWKSFVNALKVFSAPLSRTLPLCIPHSTGIVHVPLLPFPTPPLKHSSSSIQLPKIASVHTVQSQTKPFKRRYCTMRLQATVNALFPTRHLRIIKLSPSTTRVLDCVNALSRIHSTQGTRHTFLGTLVRMFVSARNLQHLVPH